MNDQQHQNEAACGGSALTAELGAEQKRRVQYCTFCGASDKEVQLLIACHAAMICDHCIQIGNEILIERGIPLMPQAAEVPNAIELTGSPLAASPATGGSDVE